MQEVNMKQLTVDALEDVKGLEIICIDVSGMTEITDEMIIVSGTSNRHVKALVNNVVSEANKVGIKPLGVEGFEEGEWVLIDLNDVVIHVMLPKVREFYEIERLWSMSPNRQDPEERPSIER